MKLGTYVLHRDDDPTPTSLRVVIGRDAGGWVVTTYLRDQRTREQPFQCCDPGELVDPASVGVETPEQARPVRVCCATCGREFGVGHGFVAHVRRTHGVAA